MCGSQSGSVSTFTAAQKKKPNHSTTSSFANMENDSNKFSQTTSFRCVPFVYLEEVEYVAVKEEEEERLFYWKNVFEKS